ncbi:hypothetical protein ACLIYM_25240 [Streptomyces fenghuangensis]
MVSAWNSMKTNLPLLCALTLFGITVASATNGNMVTAWIAVGGILAIWAAKAVTSRKP